MQLHVSHVSLPSDDGCESEERDHHLLDMLGSVRSRLSYQLSNHRRTVSILGIDILGTVSTGVLESWVFHSQNFKYAYNFSKPHVFSKVDQGSA